MSRNYLNWIGQFPLNRSTSLRLWVGVNPSDDSYEPFEA